MATLVLIADDLTGTFDASVPFTSAGVEVITKVDAAYRGIELGGDAAVVGINSESRHLSAFGAFLRVGALAERAMGEGVRIVFKKTDSVLRGNVAAELAAVWENCDRGCVHFLPGWPEMGRTTVDGVHCVDGRPVAETRFGRDPFDPVVSSSVREILAQQEGMPILHVYEDDPVPVGFSGVAFYDVSSEEDLERRAKEIMGASSGSPILLAGCAGLARAVAQALGLGEAPPPAPTVDASRLLVLFGSINPVSASQCAYARGQGVRTFFLPQGQKRDSSFMHSEVGTAFCGAVARSWDERDVTVVDATDYDPDTSTGDAKEVRDAISKNIGRIMGGIIGERTSGTLFVSGGDVLLSFLETLDAPRVRLLGEVFPGIVDTEVSAGGKTFRMLSKSGGFGSPDLIMQVARKLRN